MVEIIETDSVTVALSGSGRFLSLQQPNHDKEKIYTIHGYVIGKCGELLCL
jgi:hypothetical protein